MATATKTKTTPTPRNKAATITVTGAALAAALPRIAAVASGRSVIQALGGVLLTSGSRVVLNLDSTDLTTSVRVPVRATGSTTFEALVPVKGLQNVVKVLGPGEYTITASPATGKMAVTCGRKKMILNQLRRVDFPVALDFKAGKPVMQTTGEQARSVFLPAARYASSDETRPILTAVMVDLERRNVVATDSYRLAVFDAPGLAPRRKTQVLIPAQSLTRALVGKPSTFRLTFRDGVAVMQVDDATYAVRVVEGQYPHYQQLIPDGWEYEAVMAASDLVDAAEFADASLTAKCPVRVQVRSGGLGFSGHVPDQSAFDTDVDATVKLGKDGPCEIGVNPVFLADAARTIPPKRGGKVTLRAISPLRPLVLEGKGAFALLMPIRLNV